MFLTDTHAHLECLKDSIGVENAIENSKLNGVLKIVNASARVEDWNYYSELVKKYPNFLYWTIGVHPTEIDEKSISYLDALCSYFTDGDFSPRAIGEIGLDFYKMQGTTFEIEDTIKLQKDIFARQLEFAKDMDCPICVHARSAVLDSFEILKKSNVDLNKVVFHCFSGNLSELKILNDAGIRASFTGIITYKNAEEMRQCMLKQGLEKLMFETDCPYLSPVPFRGKTNEPARIKEIAQYAANLFGVSLDEIGNISSTNAQNFFDLR